MESFTLKVDTNIVKLGSRKIVVTSSGINEEGDHVESTQTITKNVEKGEHLYNAPKVASAGHIADQTAVCANDKADQYKARLEDLEKQVADSDYDVVDLKRQLFCAEAKIEELSNVIDKERFEIASRSREAEKANTNLKLHDEGLETVLMQVHDYDASDWLHTVNSGEEQDRISSEDTQAAQIEAIDSGQAPLDEDDPSNGTTPSHHEVPEVYDDQQHHTQSELREETQESLDSHHHSSSINEESHRKALSRLRKTTKANTKRQQIKIGELKAKIVRLEAEVEHNDFKHLEDLKELLKEAEHWKISTLEYRNSKIEDWVKEQNPYVEDLLRENLKLEERIEVLSIEKLKFRDVEEVLRDQLVKGQEAMNIQIKAAQRAQEDKFKAQDLAIKLQEELALRREEVLQLTNDQKIVEATAIILHQAQVATASEDIEATSSSFKAGLQEMLASILAQKKVADIKNQGLRKKLAKATKQLEKAGKKELKQENELNAVFLGEENAREEAPSLRAEIDALKMKLEHWDDAMTILNTKNPDEHLLQLSLRKKILRIEGLCDERDTLRKELSDATKQNHQLTRDHDIRIMHYESYIKDIEGKIDANEQRPQRSRSQVQSEYSAVTYSNPDRQMVRIAREIGHNSIDIPRHIFPGEGLSNIGQGASPTADAIGKLYPHLKVNALNNNDVGLAFPKIRVVSIEDAQRILREETEQQRAFEAVTQVEPASVEGHTDIDPQDHSDGSWVQVNMEEPNKDHGEQFSMLGEAVSEFEIPLPDPNEEDQYLVSVDDRLNWLVNSNEGSSDESETVSSAKDRLVDHEICKEDQCLAYLDARLDWWAHSSLELRSSADEAWFVGTAKKVYDRLGSGQTDSRSPLTSNLEDDSSPKANGCAKTDTSASEVLEHITHHTAPSKENQVHNEKTKVSNEGNVPVNETQEELSTSEPHEPQKAEQTLGAIRVIAPEADAEDVTLKANLDTVIDIDENEQGELPGGERIGIPEFLRKKVSKVNQDYRDVFRSGMELSTYGPPRSISQDVWFSQQ